MGDPYWGYVDVLAECDGDNGATVIQNAADTDFVLTLNDGAAVTDSPQKWTEGAVDCADALGWIGSDYMLPETQDYCVEMWVLFNHWPDESPVDAYNFFEQYLKNYAGRMFVSLRHDKKVHWQQWSSTAGTTLNLLIDVPDLTMSAWHHWAFTRWGDIHTVWLDGIDIGHFTVAGATVRQRSLKISSIYVNNSVNYNNKGIDGVVDSIRVTGGVPRYTGAFVVPSGPYPIGQAIGYFAGTADIPVANKAATIFAYEKTTGALLAVANSNPSTGEWEMLNVDLATEHRIVVCPDDSNFEPRAHGPLFPAQT